MEAAFIFVLFVTALVVFIIAMTGLRTVRPWEKGLIERLGKFQRTVDSGLTVILPFLERMIKVDLREQVVLALLYAVVSGKPAEKVQIAFETDGTVEETLVDPGVILGIQCPSEVIGVIYANVGIRKGLGPGMGIIVFGRL